MYYVKAEVLNCRIQCKIEDGFENTSIQIIPQKLESVNLNNGRLNVEGRMYGGREFIEKGIR